jgi:heme exporter protein A
MLAGLNSPESGSISYNENDVKTYQYQLDTFYLGHLPALSPELSCIENLEYLTHLSNQESKSNLDGALSKVGLNNYKNELVGTLSAGQKRRVALSALFISHSKLWLLDEPFTALDSDGIEIIENQIKKHCTEGGLCILTTHQDCKIENLRELSL